MFKDSMIIMWKEFKILFRDKRVLFMMTVFPLIFLPILFRSMGYFTHVSERANTPSVIMIYVKNPRAAPSFMNVLKAQPNVFLVRSDDPLNALKNKKLHLYIEFDRYFKEKIIGDESPMVKIFYNGAWEQSTNARKIFDHILESFKGQILDIRLARRSINKDYFRVVNPEYVDESTPQERGSTVAAMLIPYFIVIYLFSAAMSIGLGTTTSEKEKGTIGILLVNQVDRSAIVFGKIVYIMITALIYVIFTFIGMYIALKDPSSVLVMGGSSAVSSITPVALAQLFIILLPLESMIVSIIVAIGTFSKTVREATGYLTPLNILVVIVGVASIMANFNVSWWTYLIPFVNTIFAMKDIFLRQVKFINFILAILTNSIITVLFVFLTARMFNNEKILFRV